jgi:hypothetical protein
MSRSGKSKNIHDQEIIVQYSDMLPDVCPICHTSNSPKICYHAHSTINSSTRLEIIYQCAKLGCESLFIATYAPNPNGHFSLKSVKPITFEGPKFPEIIVNVSQTFLEIYTQAMAAETYSLTELTGIGLRKALEFLVKDFAISRNPEEKDKILSMLLGKCISDYLDDNNLKQCARRAAWLGNDETHYLRKWENKDIADLKILIKLVVNWIENVLLTEKYIAEMPG